MSWGAIVVGGAGMIYSGIQSGKNRRMAEDQAAAAQREQQKQQDLLNKEKQRYRQQQFKNPFSNMENVFEDITVNQQQAQFERQVTEQQRANILQNLQGAAGGSGIASLAQSMANQGQLSAQRISASIGQQESRNQVLRAKGAQSIQIAERQGQQWVQQAEMDRNATTLGMQMGMASGANQAHMQAQANQMNAQIAQQQTTMDFMGSMADPLSSAFGAMGKKTPGGTETPETPEDE